jgi:hypothetical protein
VASAAALAAAPDAAALVEPEVAALAAEQGRRAANTLVATVLWPSTPPCVFVRGLSKPAASAAPPPSPRSGYQGAREERNACSLRLSASRLCATRKCTASRSHVVAFHVASRAGAAATAATGAKPRLAEPLRAAQTSPVRPAPLSSVHAGRPGAAPTRRPPRRLAEQLRAARRAADALAAEAESQERLARFHTHLSAGAPPG